MKSSVGDHEIDDKLLIPSIIVISIPLAKS